MHRHVQSLTVDVHSTHTILPGLPRDILYVVIALGGLLLVAMVILVLFVFLACVQNKKASRRSAMLKQQVREGGRKGGREG